MSSSFIDANDLDRLSRESQLTEQAPRVQSVEPEEPAEESVGAVLIMTLAKMLSDRGLYE